MTPEEQKWLDYLNPAVTKAWFDKAPSVAYVAIVKLITRLEAENAMLKEMVTPAPMDEKALVNMLFGLKAS